MVSLARLSSFVERAQGCIAGCHRSAVESPGEGQKHGPGRTAGRWEGPALPWESSQVTLMGNQDGRTRGDAGCGHSPCDIGQTGPGRRADSR